MHAEVQKSSYLDKNILQKYTCAFQTRVVVHPLRTQKSAEKFIWITPKQFLSKKQLISNTFPQFTCFQHSGRPLIQTFLQPKGRYNFFLMFNPCHLNSFASNWQNFSVQRKTTTQDAMFVLILEWRNKTFSNSLEYAKDQTKIGTK